VPKTRK
jgi:hypothetical protein